MSTKTKQTFESAYRSLEKLVEELESNPVGLEEGVTKFEHGLELAQFCKQRLNQIENKVITIKKKFAKVLDSAGPDEEDGDDTDVGTASPGLGAEESDEEEETEEEE